MADTRTTLAASGVGFGTSGARGLVEDMTDGVCFAYTLAFLHAVGARPGSPVALGMDLRPSSPRIAAACAAAIRHAGLIPDFCGAIPTPALAFHAQETGMPAIMVTGSHIPFDRNGIKFYRAEGEITKADEAAINGAVLPMPEDMGITGLPAANPAAAARYRQRYLDFFPGQPLAGLRLGFYQHSSLARDLLTDIAQSLGAEVTPLGRTDDFVPIDTEAVSEADAAQAREWARTQGFDALMSTDGDADRPLLGDEKGDWLRGDIVGILCAQALGARAVVTPVSSNTALERCGAFARTLRTRIGSPYVIEGMETLAQLGNVVGFEANGGFLVGSPVEQDGRRLAPLPTRDAVLPILALLVEARRRGVPLSRLAEALPPRYTASDRIKNFATEKSRQLLQDLAADPAAIQALLGDLGGESAGLDQTDGLRITFGNGEIVHLRPSGNAPELRCYAEADSPKRAAFLADQCLKRVQGA
ncbi:MAG: phosphomannomutase [Pseudomonadota bacterium]